MKKLIRLHILQETWALVFHYCLTFLSLSYKQENVRKELEALVPNVSFISTKIDYGKGAANPLNEAYFFEKNRPNVLFHWEFPAPKK